MWRTISGEIGHNIVDYVFMKINNSVNFYSVNLCREDIIKDLHLCHMFVLPVSEMYAGT